MQRLFFAPVLVALLVGVPVSGGNSGEDPAPAEVETPPLRSIGVDPESAARDAVERGGEAVRMRWKFTGFLGFLASLFVPSSGNALLTTVPDKDGTLGIELLLTAPKREGEYFIYGAQIDQETGSTVAVWNRQSFRGKKKEKHTEIEQPRVIDYASAIYHLRWSAPERPTLITIWDRGKTYAAEIKPLGTKRRKIGGKKIEVRGYAVRGVKMEGSDSFDDKIFLYFARDSQSTPVEIVAKRGVLRVRMQMVEVEGTPRKD